MQEWVCSKLLKEYFQKLIPVKMDFKKELTKQVDKKDSSIASRFKQLREKLSKDKSNDVEVVESVAKRGRSRQAKVSNNTAKSTEKEKSPVKSKTHSIPSSPTKKKTIANRIKKRQETFKKLHNTTAEKDIIDSITKTCAKVPKRDVLNKQMSKESHKTTPPLDKSQKNDINKKKNSSSKPLPPVPTPANVPSTPKSDYKIPKKSHQVQNVNVVPEDMEIEGLDWSDCNENPTDEAMDWEVNELRKDFNDNRILDKYLVDSVEGTPSSARWGWMLVIDTNIFISALPFVQKALETELPGFGYPMIYVPRRVICELDGLKDCTVKNPQLPRSARNAIKYINERLTERHPRFKGETSKEFFSLDKSPLADSDDKILLSCLHVIHNNPGKRVIFLSNDINLRNKAIVDDVETYSVTEFENLLLDFNNIRLEESGRVLVMYRTRALLKVTLEEILNVEISKRKQLTSLEDAIELFINQWPRVFSNFVVVFAEEHLLRLREITENIDEPGALISLIDSAKNFLTFFYVKGKKYFTTIKKTFSCLDCLKTRANQLESSVHTEEKHYIGCLQLMLNDCWTAFKTELEKINEEKSTGSVEFADRAKEATLLIRRIVESLEGVLSCSIFELYSSPYLDSLAQCFVTFCDNDLQKCKLILSKVGTTEEGRDLLFKAEKYFKCTLNQMMTIL